MAKRVNLSKLALVFVLALVINSSYANTDNGIFKTNFSVDFMSMHTWRGYATSYVPTIEPSFELSTDNSTMGIWAAHSIDNKYSEIDLYLLFLIIIVLHRTNRVMKLQTMQDIVPNTLLNLILL